MLQVIVSGKESLTPRVCKLTLTSSTGEPLPDWAPGAHIDVFLPGDMIRQYSLCGALDAQHYQIAVQLEEQGKGGSRYIHESLQCGAELTISEPRNHFPLTEGENPCLFLAAGIGITPFIPMIEACLAGNRPFSLYYAVANGSDNLLSDQYTLLANVHVHDKATQGVRLNIDALLKAAPADSDIFVCGPNGFINDVLSLSARQGIDSARLHREFFTAEPIDHSNDGSFELEIASTGQIVSVAKDESMLEALEDNGFFVPVSCEEGVCGTCITPLLGGEADHKDVFLNDKEKAQMDRVAVCCSRAKTPRLILDL
ncbi:MAG: oxidoreductase [Alteromonadaceae bacterium TMED7]|nr:MAG: oxidoreductase [Alteromonadaceae bacterium TMED7]|tara:strand:+ start:288 stop:1226 length:939 start_codon:yes stop_codon:yes gene_type:complete